jgi:multiple sugar transport system ATP-binding protein
MVFQSYALYPNMTVAQNITFGLEMHKVPKIDRDAALAKVSKILKIEELRDRKPGQLSGGQRQRVAMGRALVRNPDVFLFDEPLSNLDAKLRVDMRTEIKKLHQNLAATIVYVTHDQIEALTLSTRIAVMNDGYVQQLGTPKEIYDTPANIFVASFIGSPSMNLIPVTIRMENGDCFAETSNGAGDDISLKLPNAGEALSAYEGKSITLGIRPEAITDSEGADRHSNNIQIVNNMAGVIEPAGSDTYVATILGGVDCVARMRADAEVYSGGKFDFAINMDKAVPFDQDSEKRIF